MRFYRDDSIDAIYDISGGDLANGVLPYLDYDLIASSGKAFWGYSDLTCVINAIYAKTGKVSVLYQVRNLVWADAELQKKRFAAYLSGDEMPLFGFRHRFLQGDHISARLSQARSMKAFMPSTPMFRRFASASSFNPLPQLMTRLQLKGNSTVSKS